MFEKNLLKCLKKDVQKIYDRKKLWQKIPKGDSRLYASEQIDTTYH